MAWHHESQQQPKKNPACIKHQLQLSIFDFSYKGSAQCSLRQCQSVHTATQQQPDTLYAVFTARSLMQRASRLGSTKTHIRAADPTKQTCAAKWCFLCSFSSFFMYLFHSSIFNKYKCVNYKKVKSKKLKRTQQILGHQTKTKLMHFLRICCTSK